MTDRDIIEGLIARDNRITEQFLFVKCRPLLKSIMQQVFSSPVEYDEMANELYDYLMEDEGRKLRQFQHRSSVYQWIKVVATRFFIRKRVAMIEKESAEPLFETERRDCIVDSANIVSAKMDVAQLLQLLENRRYADVIQHLVIDDTEPAEYARRIGVTVDNLYNIKKRAIAALTRIAIKYYGYGR